MKAIVAILFMSTALQATAAPVRVTNPLKPEIKEKAKDILLKKERAYKCTLEGRPESKWSFQNSMEVKVTAFSLQGAAELALTPWVVEEPEKNSEMVKIKVEDTVFFVQSVNCQLVQQTFL